jgi:hypothetical protein
MLQIKIPDRGRLENNWINVERDLGHVFRNLVKEAVTTIPEDAISPRPSDEEIQKFVKSLTGLLMSAEAGKISLADVDAEIASWNPGLASAFKHCLTRMMFQKYVLWRRDLLPMRPVEIEEPPVDELKSEEKKEKKEAP